MRTGTQCQPVRSLTAERIVGLENPACSTGSVSSDFYPLRSGGGPGANAAGTAGTGGELAQPSANLYRRPLALLWACCSRHDLPVALQRRWAGRGHCWRRLTRSWAVWRPSWTTPRRGCRKRRASVRLLTRMHRLFELETRFSSGDGRLKLKT